MKNLFHFFFLFFVLCMTSMVMLSSCAYYNTFYNAEKYFASAQQRPLTAQGRPNSQAIEEYNKVIRKCGVILTEYMDSKWVDNALFLLARALYYRGNNQVQSLEKFEDLMQFYPDSPFVPESIIYSARIKYELNRKDEAFSDLRAFIQNNTYRDNHPKALIEISNLYLLEKDNLQAQIYLTMLIDRYPRSKEFAEGFVILGKTYFDNGNYQKSLEIFQQLNKSRVPKRFVLDSKYYIALNYFHLERFQQAYNYMRQLEKQEFRTDKLQEQNILNARIIAKMGRFEDAISLLESVVSNSPRSLVSAEAVYYMAEIYFTKLHDYEKAIEFYNRVRRESNRSDFAEKAVTRSAVVSQILQYQRQDFNVSAEQLIAEQFKLAEYYLYVLNRPDSAIVIYDRIPIQRDFLGARIDSLNTYISQLYTLKEENKANSDSLQNDSLNTITALNEITDEIEKTKSSINVLRIDYDKYNEKFIPNALFIKLVIYNKILNNHDNVILMRDRLLNEYPENRFTEAALEYLNNEKVTFLTKHEKYLLKRHNEVMQMYPDSLDYVISFLDSLIHFDVDELKHKGLFTLGFIYYFDLADSINAQVYFDSLLTIAPASEYATFTNKFYNNKSFIRSNRLPAIQAEIDALKDKAIKNKKDSLIDESGLDYEYPDSLKYYNEDTDSLNTGKTFLDFND